MWLGVRTLLFAEYWNNSWLDGRENFAKFFEKELDFGSDYLAKLRLE